VRARFLLVVGTLLCTGTAAGCGSSPSSPSASAQTTGWQTTGTLVNSSEAPAPRPSTTGAGLRGTGANPGVIGLGLSGIGSSLQPPTSPTYKPYSSNCHLLVDPGFSGKCVVVDAPSGTVAGVVEVEAMAPSRGTGGHGQARGTVRSRPNSSLEEPGFEERDLVWHRVGPRWELAQVHVFENPGRPSLVWGDDVERDHDPKLVFVMPSPQAGFGTELDLVEGSGDVTLYRFLGQGFANVPDVGGLVTYVPGWAEQRGPSDEYDQTLIGYLEGSWRVLSEQYVPDKAALAQHREAFWDSEAVAAQ